MINKQGLWFLTLFIIILVLTVYYVAMPSNTLATLKENVTKGEDTVINVEESDALAALRVEKDTEVETTMNELQQILLNEKSTLDEKNQAYEKMKNITTNKGKEEEIENIIRDEFSYQSFVKINNDTISITISNKTHDIDIANKIIRRIMSMYSEKMYVTVKFQ